MWHRLNFFVNPVQFNFLNIKERKSVFLFENRSFLQMWFHSMTYGWIASGFKGSVVNRAYDSLIIGSFEIPTTVTFFRVSLVRIDLHWINILCFGFLVSKEKEEKKNNTYICNKAIALSCLFVPFMHIIGFLKTKPLYFVDKMYNYPYLCLI